MKQSQEWMRQQSQRNIARNQRRNRHTRQHHKGSKFRRNLFYNQRHQQHLRNEHNTAECGPRTGEEREDLINNHVPTHDDVHHSYTLILRPPTAQKFHYDANRTTITILKNVKPNVYVLLMKMDMKASI